MQKDKNITPAVSLCLLQAPYIYSKYLWKPNFAAQSNFRHSASDTVENK